MNADTQSRLEALQGRQTLYEVALVAPDGRRWFVSYTAQSGSKLRAAVARRAVSIAATMADSDPVVLSEGKNSMQLSGGWVVRFTGRTERETILEGRLPSLVEGAR